MKPRVVVRRALTTTLKTCGIISLPLLRKTKNSFFVFHKRYESIKYGGGNEATRSSEKSTHYYFKNMWHHFFTASKKNEKLVFRFS
ncbi:hypothetical protein Bcell_0611 [Evansella cellulosilytica DSM 2522]|uniref:Uncharacterized protein n=1 Tax=Evansella cellulosilytica (strain ATCC 21833 / DSM 2522 / FERM P-1141 / JCM 9156 / N-4) TaxID=649639 RepID=E6TYF5_EVAC2|nr:hypothetical protein Bcell_0611 [Evansella cellulosilytica DSM 2522]